jgi:hypothetical protein
MKGLRVRGGIAFIEFVGFLGFIGLMKRKRVEGPMPTAFSNTRNPMSPMNKATKLVGFEGS